MLKFPLLLLRLRNELWFAWKLLRDRRSPWAAKVAVVAAVAYVLCPVDFVFDWFPVLGWLDDAVVAMLLLKLASRLLPAPLRETLRAEAARRASLQG
ncbi:MAG: DUF1232 domain-containing protein [Burkholderiaceae bacterium]|jgi:uncharacterized membrane protein YkvA (DUF1232 family)|nr:DUF1232 domain-containing protein [Burkholderiaceae bacterium]